MLAKIHRLKNVYFHRLDFEWRRIRKINRRILLGKAITKLLGFASGILLLPVTVLLHFYGFRHVTIFTDRIGHLALEPDCLLKEKSMGHIPTRKWIMLAPPARVANEHMLNYWKPHFYIVRNPIACMLIANMSRWGLMRQDAARYIRAIGKAQAAYPIFAEWRYRPPLLQLTEQDKVWGTQMLLNLGLPTDAWFVCVHVRESGFSPIDEELHCHRNGSTENILPAITEIVRRGGWVVRIGDNSMASLPRMTNVIDYAHHPLKSPRLDVLLCALARFILGNTSGISLVGTIFGVPNALANMVPISAMGVGPLDISIPKLHWSIPKQRYLRFKELFDSPISKSQFGKEYAEAGIRLDENSREDILALVIEMFENLDQSQAQQVYNNSAQYKFSALMTQDHYSHGTISRISSSFLSRCKFLLQ